MEVNNIGIVLLAGGRSSRMGEPKQLLAYRGQSLLENAIMEARESAASTIVVVLGARADILKKKIVESNANVVVNTEWEEGMASSIRSGVNALLKLAPSTDGVILMVCDQPYVTSSLLEDLITTYQKTGKSIVTCSYDDTFGPPVFFHKNHFGELLQLTGDAGARKIVQQHEDEVAVVLFPQGNIDIDTKEDYEKLLN